MTPKEKAKEMYCKYADALNIRDLRTTGNPFVKQCALIAVNEFIDFLSKSQYDYVNTIIHWQQVKQEINKL